MHIGVFTYRQVPFISANTAIGYQIARQIRDDYGYKVSLIGVGQSAEQKAIREYAGMPIYYINKNFEESKINCIKEKAKKYLGQEVFFAKEAGSVQDIVNREKIDALICVIAPSDSAFIVHKAKLDIPVLLYQLDPFYNIGDVVNRKDRKSFIRILKDISWLFTTDLLLPGYLADKDISQFREKMTVLQFPKLLNNSEDYSAGRRSDAGCIRLLYGGTLYRFIRNHKILTALKEILPKEYEIVFCGNCVYPEDKKDLERSGVICKGYCTQAELKNEIENADFLINIGNTVHNQLGSKLIEYIATGKPIINITQIESCPTVPVLEKYRYHISIPCGELNTDSAKLHIAQFISDSVGKKENWETLYRNYYEYTPEHITGKIVKKINELVSDKKM